MEDSARQSRGNPSILRQRWWPVAKWTMFAVVMYFVGIRAYSLWHSSPPTRLNVDFRWLVPAAGLYVIGWLPSVWFWRALLKHMGQRVGLYETTRAYFVGHLGKYVPGKALVLVIRGALVKDAGVSPVLAALTAAYETLVSMSAGAALGVALAPSVISDELWDKLPASIQFLRGQPLIVPVIVAALTIASTPFSAWLFTRVGRKTVPPPIDAPATGISASLVIQGVLITSLGWMCHALSLGCTLRSICGTPFDIGHFPVWLASVSLSTFAGFVVLIAPGGLGVREWILIEILKDQPTIGAEQAIVAAGVLRIVWFLSELAIAGMLYAVVPGRTALANQPQPGSI